MASMVSLWLGKGFSVMRTESLEQTAQYLQVMLKKLEKENGYELPAAKANTSDVKQTKMDKITTDNIQRIMLAQIPYVNLATADAILQIHSTVAALTAALQEDASCLDSVKFLGEKGKKISRKSIESIKSFLKI
jgi:ERCC4-type nuclease